MAASSGSQAESVIDQFRVDLAVIGTSAIDADGTLLDFDIQEVQAARAIIEHARRVMLVADSSKFARSAPVRLPTSARSTFWSPTAYRPTRQSCVVDTVSRSSRLVRRWRPRTSRAATTARAKQTLDFHSGLRFIQLATGSSFGIG